jgi:hypothetical protein
MWGNKFFYLAGKKAEKVLISVGEKQCGRNGEIFAH